jgi:hypothetical protein
MQGVYFYGDLCSGKIWGLKRAGHAFVNQELLDADFSISSFGEDGAGELFIADLWGGSIYQFNASPASGGGEDGDETVSYEIRYNNAAASEVILVWGVNGWIVLPEADRPVGTVVEDSIMKTPMIRDAETFVARVNVPAGTTIDYGFLITKDGLGAPVELWESNGGQDYHETLAQDGVTEVQSKLEPEWAGKLPPFLILGLYSLIGLVIIFVVGFVFRRKAS